MDMKAARNTMLTLCSELTKVFPFYADIIYGGF
jgi:hypothetical protein